MVHKYFLLYYNSDLILYFVLHNIYLTAVVANYISD